jgi:hypothetical protein
MDSVPDPWWPPVVAAVAAWMDDPEIHEPVATALSRGSSTVGTAARYGVGDPELRSLTDTLLTLAVPRVPDDVRPGVAALAELVRGGRTPGSVLAADLRRLGPVVVLEELIHA